LTDTGRTIDEELWPATKLKDQKVRCSHCGDVHSFAKEDVILGRPTR
jgi:hypothetical protein